jgi:hypothetical protein
MIPTICSLGNGFLDNNIFHIIFYFSQLLLFSLSYNVDVGFIGDIGGKIGEMGH